MKEAGYEELPKMAADLYAKAFKIYAIAADLPPDRAEAAARAEANSTLERIDHIVRNEIERGALEVMDLEMTTELLHRIARELLVQSARVNAMVSDLAHGSEA